MMINSIKAICSRIGSSTAKFVDEIYTGQDPVFKYRNRKYQLQGYQYDGKPHLFLDQWEPPGNDYIWIKSGENDYPVDDFLEAPIWDEKTFWEVQDEMVWVDF